MTSVSESFDFQPAPAALRAALGALAELGDAGGGAVASARRREALAAYPLRAAATRVRLRGWRHDYARLRFEELAWATGRMRVPALPPERPRATRARDPADDEPPSLAVANAGGVVHLGAVYLQPQMRHGDPRVVLESLADARRTRPSAIDAVLGALIRFDADPFVALATAFQNAGVSVEIPDGVIVDAPLQLVWAARPGETSAVFAQTVVRVGRGARATIVERHLEDRDAFTCGTVEIELAEGASLEYVAIQNADDGARIAVRRAARLGAGARLGWHVADLGGALARTVLESTLAGAGAEARANVAGFARGFTNIDHAITTTHAARASFHAVARTLALDRARARFASTIRAGAAAEGGAASLHADVLAIGRDAAVAARPVFAVATPGFGLVQSASVGSLDREQLFYVRSRGVPLRAAERMIALAFFEPALAGLPTEDLRDEIRTALDERLDEIPETFMT